jgi:hypothetical protein
MPVRRLRLLAALLVLPTCAACGFLEDLADPDQPAAAAPAPAPAAAQPSEPAPREVLAVSLEDDRTFVFRGDLTVRVWPVHAGLPPLGSRFDDDCGLSDDATTQYVPVEVRFGNRSEAVAALAADVALVPAGGAEDARDEVGLFTASGDPTVRYCQDGDRIPSSDHFAVGADAHAPAGVWMYLVRHAPTAEDQARGAAPFAALGLRFGQLENRADSVPGPWAVGHWAPTGPPTAGGPCPEDPASLCAPLG